MILQYFNITVDQLLNIDDEIKKISKIRSRALLYQGILLNKDPNIAVKLSRALKESFENDNISNAFDDELKKILKKYELKDLSSNLTKFYSKSLEQDKLDRRES